MENKLYYQNAYTKTFTAELVRQGADESGRNYAVLTQTAFYPTGGGQPFDTGVLNGIKVVGVEEIDGEIRHYIQEPLEEGMPIKGEIDWDRRFDHMQQHAGQHILSAAFEELYGYKTVSFHLGKKTLTIDLETEKLSTEEADRVEKLANRVILENRPIFSKWIDGEEVKQYKLRKPLSVANNIRLVIIPEFDYNGCGGTHPNSTGEAGNLKILGWERQKKLIRVEFVCGQRVLSILWEKQAILKELSILLNAPEQDLVSSVNRLLGQKKTIEEMGSQLLQYEAAELIAANSGNIVSHVYQNRSIQELQKLARLLTGQAEEKVFLLVAENEDNLQFVFARGKNAQGNLKEWSKHALLIIDGKGGGSDQLVQGGGKWMPGDEFIKAIATIIQ
ncbi:MULTISPECIES: serine-tRNA(Ala) deacylase AlaX [Mesobacillus]|uniref:Alanyl-tRNA synthetase n=2 Tax=Mesobacillus TaxID=2675231 RepID=A0A0D6Z9K0_9BACI|nr:MULTISPECIES: serine-tRNA(Ala) deacylase AlaX [Mesobacillus]KIY21701.1 alanyl-tRNA synthetase [Mesobacillus subterraneus]MDQ0413542.1 alanyl-tRNA synthetase [Mesobacillus stamsii]